MKISKKISAILLFALCFALMLGNFSMVGAVAAAKITVSKTSAKAGENVTLTVSGSYQYEIAHATFTITYDPSVLSLSSYTTPNLGQGSAYSAINTGTAGKINYAYAYPSSTATSGNFLTLTFAVSQSAPVGESVVTISSNEIGNNVYPHTGTVVAGGVTITASNITVTYKAETGGTVSSSSETINASTGTLKGSTATASSGYTFSGWYNSSGTKVSSSATYVPTSKTTATYTAKFTENQANITYKAETGGTVSSSSETVKVVTGTIKGSTATASSGYTFSGWYNASGTKVSSSATYVPTSKTTATYTAKFTENQATITYKAGTGGTVSSSSETVKVVTGTVKGSTATANAGYSFDGWYNANGTKVSSSATYVPTSKTTATYTAKFTENQATITYSTEGQGGTVSSTSETVNVVTGTVKGSTATANAGYVFDGWYDANGNKVSSSATFIPTSKTTATYYAKFSFAILYGDINGDKIVDATDALLVLQFSVDKISNFSDIQKESADVDDDGVISVSDALHILHKSVDKIDKFPVELY